MNANHARPLTAFWLLAIVAAVITSTGLRASHSDVPASLASPAPISSSDVPELVLGGVLRPDGALTHPLAPQMWAQQSETGPAGGAVQVASPSAPTTAHKARTKSTGSHDSGATHAQPSPPTTTTTTTETVSATGHGHGKGRDKHDQPAKTTTTATATPTEPTEPTKGGGSGRPDTVGR